MHDYLLTWLKANDSWGMVGLFFGLALACCFIIAIFVRIRGVRQTLLLSMFFAVVSTVLFASWGLTVAANDLPGFVFVMIFLYPIALVVISTAVYGAFYYYIKAYDFKSQRRRAALGLTICFTVPALFLPASIQRVRTFKLTEQSFRPGFDVTQCSQTFDERNCISRATKSASDPTVCSQLQEIRDEIKCLLGVANKSENAKPCELITALEQDPRTIFIEEVPRQPDGTLRLTREQTVRAIDRLSFEVESGKCYFHQSNRAEWISFCERVVAAKDYPRMVASRCSCVPQLEANQATFVAAKAWITELPHSVKDTFAADIPKPGEFPLSPKDKACRDIVKTEASFED